MDLTTHLKKHPNQILGVVNMRIASLLDVSLVDVPGIPVSVIFTGGCNFNCPYCHNAQLIPLNSGEEVVIDELIRKLSGSLSEGFCITGGEPTLHSDLPELLMALKESCDCHINLNTQGSIPHVLEKCIPYLDSVWFDLKAAPSRYEIVAGARGNPWPRITKSFKIIMQSDVELWPRTTYVSGLMNPDDIKTILDFLKSVGFEGDYLIQNFISSSGVREEMRERCKVPDKTEILQVIKHPPEGIKVRLEWR